MKTIYTLPFILFSLLCNITYAQTDADDLLDSFGGEEETNITKATFKTTRLALGYSVENPSKQDLVFLISHHFGSINTGFYELYGLDKATMRLGFEYGVTDRLTLAIGRSTYNKTYDGYIKYKILQQSNGAKNIPATISLVSQTNYVLIKNDLPKDTYFITNNISYMLQALIARKFNKSFSAQIMPTIIHRNLVATKQDSNDKYALGAGARYKIGNRTSFNIEYHYLFENYDENINNSLTMGIDIETGGHVFQLFFTNSVQLSPLDFISNTTGDWTTGNLFFGFNLTRTFTLGNKKI